MEKMEENIMKKLSEIKLDLISNIKTELKKECEDMKASASAEITKELRLECQELRDTLTNKFELLEKENTCIKSTLEEQKILLDRYELERRKNNIVIYGLDTKDRRSLGKKFLHVVNDLMKVKCQEADLDFIKILGKSNTNNTPVLIRFVSFNKKIEILKSRKTLQNTDIYIY